MKLHDALYGVTRLGFDTSPIIYFVEANPQYDARVTWVFQQVAGGALQGLRSVVTLSEVLVQPLMRGDIRIQQEYRDLLLYSRHFQTLPIDNDIAERAADLRVRYRLRTPDAFQVAAALNAGCEAFLNNDTVIKRVTELRVLTLDELEL